MKKCGSIKETKEDKQSKKNAVNQACVSAITDNELKTIKGFIEREQRLREEAREREYVHEMENRMELLKESMHRIQPN